VRNIPWREKSLAVDPWNPKEFWQFSICLYIYGSNVKSYISWVLILFVPWTHLWKKHS